MNIVISQVEESIHIVDVTDDGHPLPPRVRRLMSSFKSEHLAHTQVEKRNVEMLFVRGDGVILVRNLTKLLPLNAACSCSPG